MKLRTLPLLGFVGLLCTSLMAEPLMVTHLKGEVTNDLGHPVQLMMRMETGQSLSLSNGAVVTLTSLKNGARYTVSGEAKARVEKVGVALLVGEESKLKKQDGRSSSGRKPKDISSSMGGILHRSEQPKPRILSVGKLSEPVLHWQEFPNALRYEVTVVKRGKVVCKIDTKDLSAQLPLKKNKKYEVKLAAIVASSKGILDDSPPQEETRVSTTTVTLLGKKLPESILSLAKDKESELYSDSQNSTDIAIVFSQLFEQKLYYDALQVLDNAKFHERELSFLRSYLMKTINEAQNATPQDDDSNAGLP